MAERNGYIYSFSCEATLNIADGRSPRADGEALFETVFCGIERRSPRRCSNAQGPQSDGPDHGGMKP